MKKNQWVAVIMVTSIPSLALASVGSAPVPGPASMLLFGTGLIGVAIMRIKYKAKQVKKAKNRDVLPKNIPIFLVLIR